ncbi:MAG: glycosyltransferase [Tannerella sp.]|jgi:glycosyltransferase involved in cell wall biosynthesis|nr:glycosyltransferase [Tannerella sp.]
MFYSLIIPVYNRPDEVSDLLQSLVNQSYKDFEVIVVEDGSSVKCEDIVSLYADKLNVKYLYKENSGPGDSRNYGVKHSKGDYVIVLDSDCVIPERYMENVHTELTVNPCDVFGGPDAAHPSFSKMQKAVNYAMTSLFTTGGIRGGKRQMEKFHPRSFNMGMKKEVYEQTGGFSKMRYGEDIDFSIRLFDAGYKVRLFPKAYVWHKRRTNMKKFFMQVFHSGCARIALYRLHPSSLKSVHLLPALFVCGLAGCLLLAFCSLWFLAPVIFYITVLFADSLFKTRNLHVACLSVVASFVQVIGYGTGFISSLFKKK